MLHKMASCLIPDFKDQTELLITLVIFGTFPTCIHVQYVRELENNYYT